MIIKRGEGNLAETRYYPKYKFWNLNCPPLYLDQDIGGSFFKNNGNSGKIQMGYLYFGTFSHKPHYSEYSVGCRPYKMT